MITKTTTSVRTRFAPSPTGYLHIGGARTALFSYLFARQHQGVFVLRVEDTDKQRSTNEATEAILDGMKWLGLCWDEGPFFQSQRGEHYQKAIQQLFTDGRAYACECSIELLEDKRKQAMAKGQKAMYDGTCREKNLPQKPGNVIRFKSPRQGETVVDDLIKGRVVFNNQELDDMILLRADGSPTYNFVVVIDDIDMRITHIIRGDDHLNNTPKQIQLYEALGATLPHFAHVPLILGEDKSRLSKRHGATSVQSYREEGFLPEAMVNFLARIGWSHGDEELFTLAELIKKFDLAHVSKSAGVFNEDKLLWLNHHYLRQLSETLFNQALSPFVTKAYGVEAAALLQTTAWEKLSKELRERCKTLGEFPAAAQFFFSDQLNYDETVLKQHLTVALKPALIQLRDALKAPGKFQNGFDETAIETVFQEVLATTGLKMKNLAQAVRLALTGTTVSPGIYLLLAIVGQQRSVQRLDQAIKMIDMLDGAST
jgi:glutamyl-tRNA synthetase